MILPICLFAFGCVILAVERVLYYHWRLNKKAEHEQD